jgi:hypothetical protein
MQLSEGGVGPLVPALEQIANIDKAIDEMERSIKDLKKQRIAAEKVAVDEMLASRLDGVRAASRSWRVEWTHSMSVPADRRDEVLDAARAEGWAGELVQVNTSRLKALLSEKAKDAGTDARASFVDGTRFEGLVGEYVQPVLRHVTVR